MSKRKNEASGDDGPTGPASNKAARITPGTTPTTENPPSSSGLKNTLHGTMFQLKLLALFLLRGINAGVEFCLGTEIPGTGGKFNDIIFKFKKHKNDKNSETIDEQTECYQFLQAKHKQNEEKEKITAADLLKDNDGEFSLPKYFRSYCHDIIKLNGGILPESIQDCIICTNIGFDSEEELRKSGIGLICLDHHDDVLSFNKTSDKKTPARYRLEKTEELRNVMTEWSDVHLLAKTFLKNVTERKQLALSSPIFKKYHVALVRENVIELWEHKKMGRLCSTFIKGNSRFREILSEVTFAHYWEKLNFKYDDKKLLIQLEENLLSEYYENLISEKVLEADEKTRQNKPFTKNFIKGKNLTEKGSEFRGKLRNAVFIHIWKYLSFTFSANFGRKKISTGTPDENKSLNDLPGEKEIDDFLGKLVFAVHTPNEVQLDDILKMEVSDRYSKNENDFQSDYILRNMLDWLKSKESKFMTSAEGIVILEDAKKKMKSLR